MNHLEPVPGPSVPIFPFRKYSGLDVVIGLGYQRLHAARMAIEISRKARAASAAAYADCGHRVDRRICREREVPLDFDPHAITYQRVSR